jgi:hypothetical protein
MRAKKIELTPLRIKSPEQFLSRSKSALNSSHTLVLGDPTVVDNALLDQEACPRVVPAFPLKDHSVPHKLDLPEGSPTNQQPEPLRDLRKFFHRSPRIA